MRRGRHGHGGRSAEEAPSPDRQSLDDVLASVSNPYTNIKRGLQEIQQILGIPAQAISSNIVGPLQTLLGTTGGANMADSLASALSMFMGVPEESTLNTLASKYNFADANTMRDALTPEGRLNRLLPAKSKAPEFNIDFPKDIPANDADMFKRALARSAARHPGIFSRIEPPVKLPGLTAGRNPDPWGVTESVFESDPLREIMKKEFRQQYGVDPPIEPGSLRKLSLSLNPGLAEPGAAPHFLQGLPPEKLEELGLTNYPRITPEEMTQSVIEHELTHVGQSLAANRGLSPILDRFSLVDENWEPAAYSRQFSLLKKILEQPHVEDYPVRDIQRLYRPQGKYQK